MRKIKMIPKKPATFRDHAPKVRGEPSRWCPESVECPWIADQLRANLRPWAPKQAPREPVGEPAGKTEESDMHPKRFYLSTVAAIGLAALLAPVQTSAQTAVAIDNDDIGGVVRGPNGPEAGVWVIAETNDLATRYTRSVVTDDQGRYVVPDLPKAKYQVWVRGYGLVDSPKVASEPGKQLNLTAVMAPSAAAAAQYYPAIYWWSMLKIPEASRFGAKSDIPEKITQIDWIRRMKNNGCVGCHQMGTLATRTIPAVFGASSKDAWIRRIQAGQAGENMVNIIAGELGTAPLPYLTDWTDRVAAGELPRESPKRPQGVERNIVVTTWDWSDEKHYLHDLISTDKRNPTVNGYGQLFGQPEYAWDNIPILDPVKSTATLFHAPIRDPNMHEMLGPGHAASERPLGPSAYWGEEKVWDTHINNHNATISSKGRVWLTAAFRNSKDQPAWCKQDSGHPSAKLFPLNESHRTLAILESKTMKYTFVDTCYGTHQLNFAYDANETLWTSGGGPVLGWFNTKLFDETGDVAKAQGWTAFVLDTKGDGKRGEYTEPNQPFDPSKDRRIPGNFYAVSVNPVDGSIWGTVGVFGGRPGVVRVDPGPNPPETAI